MSIQHVPGSPDKFELVIDFDLQGGPYGTWVLVAQTDAAKGWVVKRFKQMAHPILDVEGTALVIDLIQRDDLLLSIEGELRHG